MADVRDLGAGARFSAFCLRSHSEWQAIVQHEPLTNQFGYLRPIYPTRRLINAAPRSTLHVPWTEEKEEQEEEEEEEEEWEDQDDFDDNDDDKGKEVEEVEFGKTELAELKVKET